MNQSAAHAQLVAMARHNLGHVAAGSIDQTPDVARVPAANYLDPARFEREVSQIFRRLPLMLALSCELPGPGSYKALTAADTPVLIARGRDGEVRAFLNSCSHRGAQVVLDGTGQARRFMCPYHAWTYDEKGALVGILSPGDFGEIDKSCHGLTALRVAERAGLIWVSLDPSSGLDIDTFLCGYDALLATFGFENWHLVGRREVPGPNWKIAYDGYLDFYHLPILHRESFGSKIPSRALYDAWGPHQRVSMPNPAYGDLQQKPEDEWDPQSLISGIWTIFPHVSIAPFDAEGKLYMVSQLFPGPSPAESVTVQTFLSPSAPDAARNEPIQKLMGFLEHVVRDQDYYMGKRIQLALKAGAKDACLFGRNEAGGQRFHRWVDALVQTDDDGLAGLFRSGIEF